MNQEMKKRGYRSLCASLCLALLLTLTACQPAGEAGTQKKPIVVGYAQVGAESAWRRANTASFQEAFGHDPMYDYIFVDCRNKMENQLAAVSDFIAQQVDYIVIAPYEETGWDQILQEAKDANIPVILTDRMIKTDDSLYTAWVGSNFVEEGRNAMEWLDRYLKETGRDQETLNVLHMQGSENSSAQRGRTESIEVYIESHDYLHLLAKQSGEFTLAKGREVMENWLARFKEEGKKIDILIAENDDMAFGAIKAMEAYGLKPGEDVIIISFDAGYDAVQAVIDGKINCTVECNPLHGPRVKEIIEQLENGIMPEKAIEVEEGWFDSTNAEAALPTRWR